MKKVVRLLTSVLVVVLFLSFIKLDNAKAAEYSLKEGDVFVTTSTVAIGVTGHAGIVIKDKTKGLIILHFPKPGSPISTITLSQWKTSYPNTEVYRTTSTDTAQKAARWAYANYEIGSKPTYSFALDLSSTSKSYCSKIVWQGYYYGANKAIKKPWSNLATPYSLALSANYNVSISKVAKYGRGLQ